jgi:hypothetical protein
MGARLLRIKPSLVDEGLGHGLVLRDLLERPIAKEVRTRVSDVSQADGVAREQQGRQGSAHAVEVGVVVDVPAHGRVGPDDGVTQLGEHIISGVALVERRQLGDHERGGDLACGVAAHPVGQRQQPGSRVGGVLVVLALVPAVGGGRVAQVDRHSLALTHDVAEATPACCVGIQGCICLDRYITIRA